MNKREIKLLGKRLVPESIKKAGEKEMLTDFNKAGELYSLLSPASFTYAENLSYEEYSN